MIRESKAKTTWLIEVPAPKDTVKQYHASTYPNSSLIFLQSAARGRVIAEGNATKLLPIVRAAIDKARATQQPTGEPQ